MVHILLWVCLRPQSDGETQSRLAGGQQNKRKILNGEQAGFKVGRLQGLAPEPKVRHITKLVGLALKGKTQCGSWSQHGSSPVPHSVPLRNLQSLLNPSPNVCATFVELCVANLSELCSPFISWTPKVHLKLGGGKEGDKDARNKPANS